MQQEKKIEMKTSHRKCCVAGCSNRSGRMFTFPPLSKDYTRCLRWVEACGRPDLLLLPPRKLQQRTVCARHFEEKYFLRKRLSNSAVPTCHLPVPTSSEEPQSADIVMAVEEEEDELPDKINMEPQEDAIMDIVIRKEDEFSLLKILNNSVMEQPLKKKLYNAFAALLKAGKQCKRQRLALKERIKQFEHLVQVIPIH